MTDSSVPAPKSFLDPRDRFEEIVFGLIMVLTFSCSLSVADAGRADVRGMIIGALGCNLAWGIIDAAFYLIGVIAERGRNAQLLRQVQRASDPAAGRIIVAGSLPPLVAECLAPQALEQLRASLAGLPEPTSHVRLTWADALGGLVGLPPGLPLDLPGRPPVLLLRRGSHGAAHLERSRHCADLLGELQARPALRPAALPDRRRDGRHRRRAGGARHRSRRLTPAAPRGLEAQASRASRTRETAGSGPLLLRGTAIRIGSGHGEPPGKSPRSIRPAVVGAPSGLRSR